MERDGRVSVGAGSSILQVSLYRTTDMSKLASDLVVTTRVQVYLDQRIASFRMSYQPIVQYSQLAPRTVRIDDKALIEFLIAEKVILQSVF